MPLEQQEVDATYIISDLNNRVRTLENKYNLMGERLLVVNQNMILQYKKIIKEISLINSDLRELKKDIATMKDTFQNMVMEMETFAKKDSVKALEKYIDLWNPMGFVTDEEVKKIVEDKLKRKKR